MDFNASTWWWLGAGVLVAAELLTGTFYLLMMALGCSAAALAAHAGGGGTVQVLCAAVAGGGATAAWHFKRARAPRSAPAESNPDVNLDIGQTLQVQQWTPDGRTQVHYRGAMWSARLVSSETPGSGEHRIVAVHGNVLDLAPAQQRPQ